MSSLDSAEQPGQHSKSTDVVFRKRPLVLTVLKNTFTVLPTWTKLLSALSLFTFLSVVD